MNTSIHRRTLTVLATLASLAGALMASAPAQAATTGTAARPFPVVLDGVRYQPGDTAVTSRNLVYVVDRQAQAEGVVYAYHTSAAALARLDAADPSVATDLKRVQFFEKPGRGGDVLDLGPGEIKLRLIDEGRRCPFWPICEANWNNQISSLDTNGGRVTLYRDNDLSGPKITFGSGLNVDLKDYKLNSTTWDNRVSSVHVHS